MEIAYMLDSTGNPPLLCKILRRTLNVSCYFARTNVSQMATGSSCVDLAEWFSFFWRIEHVCVNVPFSVCRWAHRLTRMAPVLPCWLKHSSWQFWALTTLFSIPFLVVDFQFVEQYQNICPYPQRGKEEGKRRVGFIQEWKQHIPKMRS